MRKVTGIALEHIRRKADSCRPSDAPAARDEQHLLRNALEMNAISTLPVVWGVEKASLSLAIAQLAVLWYRV